MSGIKEPLSLDAFRFTVRLDVPIVEESPPLVCDWSTLANERKAETEAAACGTEKKDSGGASVMTLANFSWQYSRTPF